MMEQARQPERLFSGRDLALLGGTFAVVHAVAYLMGLRFSTDTLTWFMQILDPEWLRHRLLESLFYLHMQPPLFNLFIGIGLKLGDTAAPVFFQGAYLCMGFATYAAVYGLQRALRVSRPIAFVFSTVLMASPGFLLTEHWLFYPMPCAAFLILSCVGLWAFSQTGNRAPLWGFFACLIVLAGIRTVFHLVWVGAMGAALFAAFPQHRKRVALAGVVAVILVALPYAKNAVLFGEFTVCTWSEQHLWIKTVGNMDQQERRRLYEEGMLSEVSRPGMSRFEPLELYDEKYLDVAGFEGIPALREPEKSTGFANYNHIARIAISNVYGRDARYVLFHYPKTFVLTTVQSGLIYLNSNASWARETRNHERLWPWVWFYDAVLFGRLPFNLFAPIESIARVVREQYAVLMVVLPAAFLVGAYAAARGRFAGRALSKNERLALAYMVFNIFFVGSLAMLFEVRETPRMRFMTDPLTVVLLGFALQGLVAYLRRGKRAGAPSP